MKKAFEITPKKEFVTVEENNRCIPPVSSTELLAIAMSNKIDISSEYDMLVKKRKGQESAEIHGPVSAGERSYVSVTNDDDFIRREIIICKNPGSKEDRLKLEKKLSNSSYPTQKKIATIIGTSQSTVSRDKRSNLSLW